MKLIWIILALMTGAAPAPATTGQPATQAQQQGQPQAKAAMPGTTPTWRKPPSGTPTIYGVLPLGDSITAGTNGTHNAYRGRLAQLRPGITWIGAQGSAPLRHEGHPGASIEAFDSPAFAELVSVYRPAYILINLGTNDAGNGNNNSTAQMVAEMRSLLTRLRAAAGPNICIIVMQPTITLINTPAQQAALNGFDDALPGLVAEFGWAQTVDLRGVPIDAAHGGDGVHPGDVGYDIIADRLAAVLPTIRIA